MRKILEALLPLAMLPQPKDVFDEDGSAFIPSTTGTSSKGFRYGKLMPQDKWRKRKKKMKMQKESRRKNRVKSRN
jgi:hypothetical protein